MSSADLRELIGKKIVKVEGAQGDGELILHTRQGERFRFYHEQDCCEGFVLAEVVGDLDDLLWGVIMYADVVSSDSHPAPQYAESYTWTFYRLRSFKGEVVLRFLGTSNGYYSERCNTEWMS